jgi:isopenicillin-N N-acyltransferase-like protein
MGLQYGAQCQEIDKLFEILRQAAGLDQGAALLAAEKFIPYIQGYSPDIMDELRGIAEGARVDTRQVVFLNIWYELGLRGFAGCTSYAASAPATRDGELIAGQNFDQMPQMEGMLVMLKMKPAQGPRILALTMAGMVGLIAINSAGVTVDGNFLAHRQFTGFTPGVPHMIWLRQAQASVNIGRAFGAIAGAKRSGVAVNALLGSRQGDIVDIEVTPNDLGILYPNRGFITHSNHFYTERLKPYDMIGAIYPDSIIRSQRLAELMEKNHGKISVEVMKGLLQDHNNHPESICRHLDPEIPASLRMKTVASIISHPKEQKMYIAWGNPCENEYLEYQL